MQEHELEIIKKAVSESIEKNVNGKVREIHRMLEEQNDTSRQFREKVEAHIERVEPVVKAYEDEKAFRSEATKYGDRAIFWSKIVGAIGILFASVVYTVNQVVSHKP